MEGNESQTLICQMYRMDALLSLLITHILGVINEQTNQPNERTIEPPRKTLQLVFFFNDWTWIHVLSHPSS